MPVWGQPNYTYNPTGNAATTNNTGGRHNPYLRNVPNINTGQVNSRGRYIYDFSRKGTAGNTSGNIFEPQLDPVTFDQSAFSFQTPDVAGLASQFQEQLDPRFDALRDSRTSQLKADFDFLRSKEEERLNQRGLIGSGVENEQIGRFNTEFSRQLSQIDSELAAAQQEEAFKLAGSTADLQFKTQVAQAENNLNTEIARTEVALKSGQLNIAERGLLLDRYQQLIDYKNELLKRKIEFASAQFGQLPEQSGSAGGLGQAIGSSLSGLGGAFGGGGGGSFGGAANDVASGATAAVPKTFSTSYPY